VVVDMQMVFAKGAPWATPGFEELEAPLLRLVEAFGERVVFTRFVLPRRPHGSWTSYYQTWPAVTLPEASPLFELVPPWLRMARSVVEKPTFSKWGPELQALAGGSRTLVLCGVSTDCCLLATALAAVDDGMYVHVVSDAAKGATAEAHERVLALVASFAPQARVTTVAKELQNLSGAAER
jgi:nicotinamidase-related amidase